MAKTLVIMALVACELLLVAMLSTRHNQWRAMREERDACLVKYQKTFSWVHACLTTPETCRPYAEYQYKP